jgi:hypothetical protein
MVQSTRQPKFWPISAGWGSSKVQEPVHSNLESRLNIVIVVWLIQIAFTLKDIKQWSQLLLKIQFIGQYVLTYDIKMLSDLQNIWPVSVISRNVWPTGMYIRFANVRNSYTL